MLRGMNLHPRSIAFFSILAAARIALADPPAPNQPKPPAKAEPAAAATGTPITGERKALMRQLRGEREKMVHDKGEIFARIAVKHDYTGEYVLFRDQDVTAFLDLKDPRHPRYTPPRSGHDDDAPVGDPKRVSHILVVPNEPRETIGKTVASDITAEDLELALKVMRTAATLATRFGVKNPKIYVKSPARVGVGYLHVHILGERDPASPYPPPLK
jgi:diadenosine tetraphosphate (Ap4A) HIT family hydrolase